MDNACVVRKDGAAALTDDLVLSAVCTLTLRFLHLRVETNHIRYNATHIHAQDTQLPALMYWWQDDELQTKELDTPCTANQLPVRAPRGSQSTDRARVHGPKVPRA